MSLSVDPRIGSELFGYRVEALLGRGGMSVVYRAHDLALDRKVALKLLAPELAEDERFRSRFLRESRVAASLDHPNVIPIYEAGEAEGLLCIAMRYVEGTDLERLLRAEGALDPEQALAYDPLAVAVGAGAVWVAAKSATAEVVLEIDPRTGKIVRTVELGGADIASIAIGNSGVWVLQGDRISRLDPGTGKITRRASLPALRVAQVAVGEGAVWITMQRSNGGNALVRLDPRTLRKTRTIMMPRGHNSATLTRVAVGRGAVWWDGADDGTVWRVDPKSGDITDAIRVTHGLRATADILPLALTADADAVWVTVSYGP